MKKKNLFLAIVISIICIISSAQETSYDIRINQEGFLPNAQKIAAIINTESDSFQVVTSDMSTVVFQGEFLTSAYYPASEEDVSIADFTLLQDPGEYVIVVSDIGKSVAFPVKENVFTDLSKASIKAFYLQRASIPILSEYAGVHARAMGHPDNAIVVHPSAASASRPAGTIISTPGGWYDAGDYNKYIVNSGITVFTLLSAYETYPEYYDTLDLNIPESSNQIPDILDEALWNIKWMMSMQDTVDGGVYNKTTQASFSGTEMPALDASTRYVVAKGTAATLDFAAIMAMTARIYKKYDSALAGQALGQALNAWQWAQANPDVEFLNPDASGGYPRISTGGYGDANFEDEFSWSAAELYITTKDTAYYDDINLDQTYDMPGWPIVQTLGLLSLITHKDSLTPEADTALAKSKLIELASIMESNIITSPYRIPGDFYYWGGNNAYANWGMLFLQAFKLTGNASFFNAGLSSLDYLLGKNATSYCFVTGTGIKSPMNIHHRISAADGIADPFPGLLVSGPNTTHPSDCGEPAYPSTLPARAYLDQHCSYSTNEIAINYNAPLAFLAGALHSEYQYNFMESIPVYLSVSAKSINMPANKGFEYELIVEGNTGWTLQPSEEWISISVESGTGRTATQISCNTDNDSESDRGGYVYVYNMEKVVDSITIIQNGKRRSFRLVAEDYTDMLGVQTESTLDIDGGLNLGFVDKDDWATYDIDISYSGTYDVTIRHAGWAGNFDILVDDTFLQTVTFAETSDWQDWESYVTQMDLTEGEHVLKLLFNSPGTNLNWFDFEWVSEINSLNQQDIDNHVNVFPIPAHNHLYIDFGSQYDGADIQLFSLDGKLMLHQVCQDRTNEVIDLKNIKEGMYILKVNTNTEIFTRKIIIQ